MKKTIKEKAWEILIENKIQLDFSGQDRAFYTVGYGLNQVKIQVQNNQVHNCTCRSCSILGQDSKCCFKEALRIYLAGKDVKN